jgi:hypothetical protein
VDVAAALRPETHARLTPELLRIVQTALGHSLRDVFLDMVGIAALAIVCSLGLRGGRAESHADAGRPHRRHAEGDELDLAAALEL